MYLYKRSPYKSNKKYCIRSGPSISIQKIVTSRLDDLKMYYAQMKDKKQNKVRSMGDGEYDYFAFGLTRRCNQPSQGRLVLEEMPENGSSFNANQEKRKQVFKQPSELSMKVKNMKNRVKLAPLKQVNCDKKRYYPGYLESPAELNEELKPKFIF